MRTLRKFRVGLLEQLEQLETEQYQNALSIVETQRRLYTLAQVKSWSLPEGRLRSYSAEELDQPGYSAMGIDVKTLMGVERNIGPSVDEENHSDY